MKFECAAGYYLNPAIFHGEKSTKLRNNREIVTGLYVAIDRLVPDEDENDKVRQDLNLYIDSTGQFGSAAAIRGRTKVAPCKYNILTYSRVFIDKIVIISLHLFIKCRYMVA